MARVKLAMIAAMTMANGIGKDAGLPWKLKGEMAYFRKVTTHVPSVLGDEGGESSTAAGKRRNAVIMGRKTWASIPPKFRPLKDRLNIVISRTSSEAELGIDAASSDVKLCKSLESAYELLRQGTDSDLIARVFVIGGAQLYTDLINHTSDQDGVEVDRLLVTRILGPQYECDAFFPEFRSQEQLQEDLETTHEHANSTIDNTSAIHPLSSTEWTRASTESIKEYLGSSCPADLADKHRMIVQEDATWYEYQMWQRK
ncbi:hypothetical protein BCV70DRAFT_105331 [Testicularia cyperi]|uniref:Dihydrofolate reductase n=1 Tax=Testicularia cyperi TaxID=1882483 RepID=A0A317XPC6_9BASI|nr:hypothetical protein BCV70DRAFT_105331 [Testicularia cyperi]